MTGAARYPGAVRLATAWQRRECSRADATIAGVFLRVVQHCGTLTSGEVVQDHVGGPAYYTDPYELLLATKRGSLEDAQLFSRDTRFVDPSGYGGPTNAAARD